MRGGNNVVIEPYDGRGVGLPLNEWIAIYGDNPYDEGYDPETGRL